MTTFAGELPSLLFPATQHLGGWGWTRKCEKVVSAITFNYFKSEQSLKLWISDNERFNCDEISNRGYRQEEEKKRRKKSKREIDKYRERCRVKNIIYYCVPRTHRNGFPNADNVRKIIRMLLV